jgi:hypothetical protein
MKRLLIYASLVACLLASGCGVRSESGSSAMKTAGQRITSGELNASEPAVAVAPGGGPLVAYVEHTTKDAGDVWLQRFGTDGQPTGDRVRINANSGEAKSWYGDPPVVKIGADNSVYVTWTGKSVSGGNDLYLSVSHDGGATFDAPVKVNDDEKASPGLHSLAIGPNGETFVAWLDERSMKMQEEMQHAANGHSNAEAVKATFVEGDQHKMHQSSGDGEANRELYFAVSKDGGRSFGPNRRIASEVCPCCKTSMAVAPDGKLYVSWRQVLDNGCRHIAVASSADAGSTFAEPSIVSDDQWQINACPVSGAAMTATANGLDIYWYTAGAAGQPGLYSAHSTDGKTFAARQLVNNSNTGGMPSFNSDYVVFASAGKTIVQRDGKVLQTIDAAENPVAVISGNKLFVAYVNNSEGKKSINIAEL